VSWEGEAPADPSFAAIGGLAGRSSTGTSYQPAKFHTLSRRFGPVRPVVPVFLSFRFITAVDASTDRGLLAIGCRQSARMILASREPTA